MERMMTVHYVCGRRDSCVPMIRIRGKWLEAAGFRVSDKYRVEMLDVGSLILRRIIDGEYNGRTRQAEEQGAATEVEGTIGVGQGGGGSRHSPGPIPFAPSTATTTVSTVAETITERTL